MIKIAEVKIKIFLEIEDGASIEVAEKKGNGEGGGALAALNFFTSPPETAHPVKSVPSRKERDSVPTTLSRKKCKVCKKRMATSGDYCGYHKPGFKKGGRRKTMSEEVLERADEHEKKEHKKKERDPFAMTDEMYKERIEGEDG